MQSQAMTPRDAWLDAMKLGRESRTASRQMGRQVIRLAAGQHPRPPLLEDFLAPVQDIYAMRHSRLELRLFRS